MTIFSPLAVKVESPMTVCQFPRRPGWNRFLVLPALLAVLSGCERSSAPDTASPAAANQPATPARLDQHIGWIHGACLAIKNSQIQPGTEIQIILLSKPQRVLDARVTGTALTSSECFALQSDRAEINKQDSRYFYRLDTHQAPANAMAIGLVSKTIKASLQGQFAELDLNHDGIAEHAGSCLTSEGVQFYITAGTTFDSKALWSDYYYLGYDNQPTCPQQGST
jgi:hypothetical protein